MNNMYYEQHIHKDPDFPVIFHHHCVKSGSGSFWTHWHENIEILMITRGNALIFINGSYIPACEGDIVVINSDNMHYVTSSEETEYDCLIIGTQLCGSFGIDIESTLFENRVRSVHAAQKFLAAKKELTSKDILYKHAVKALITDLMIYLYRNHCISQQVQSKDISTKIDLAKKAVKYIRANWNEKLCVDDIASHVGVTKFYFCRIFKQYTGYTPFEYINLNRCMSAKRILQSGKNTVSSTAFLCGYENLSYFIRTYKKYIGCTPSETLKSVCSSL